MIETLESRIAPAGILNIALRHGDVFVTGDAGDHPFTVSRLMDGSLAITPDGDVLLKVGAAAPTSDPFVITGVVRDLHINLGAGNDTIHLEDLHSFRNVTVAMGGGSANALTMENSDVLGSLTISGSADVNSVTLLTGDAGMFIAGRFGTTFSKGNNELNASGEALRVGGALVYAGGSGSDSVSLATDKVLVGGRFATSFGNGGANLAVTVAEDATVAGAVSISMSGRADTPQSAFLFNADNGRLSFGSGLAFSSGLGSAFLSFSAIDLSFAGGVSAGFLSKADSEGSRFEMAATHVSVGGNVKVSAASNLEFFIGAPQGLLVGGDVSVTAGTGSHQLVLDPATSGTIGGKLAVQMTGGETGVNIGDDTAPQPLTIVGGLSIVTSPTTESSNIALQNLVLHGPSQVVTGSGFDTVLVQALQILAPLTISTGAGMDQVSFGSLPAIHLDAFAPVVIRTGAGEDTVLLGGGETTSFTAHARFSVNGGSGADNLDYLTRGNTFDVSLITTSAEFVV